jgi:hypothetical protein
MLAAIRWLKRFGEPRPRRSNSEGLKASDKS